MTFSLLTIRSHLEAFESVGSAQQQLKVIPEVHINAEPQQLNTQVMNDLREDLPAELLYTEENIKDAVILICLLQKYLVLKDF